MDTTIDITGTKLETERLILRTWHIDDLADFFEYACVDGVGEMAGWKHHESLDISKKILTSFIDEKNVFAIVYKKTGKVIGSLGLHNSWANDDAAYKDLKVKEIGYVLSKAYWGKGLMPEAVNEVIRFCFEDRGLDVLTIGHFETNCQSRRVIEKCGFRFVKNGEYYAKHLQKSFNDMKYILLNPQIVNPQIVNPQKA
jgi:[ribosomal protein S5]-alanine N-acetyltransferase